MGLQQGSNNDQSFKYLLLDNYAIMGDNVKNNSDLSLEWAKVDVYDTADLDEVGEKLGN